MFIELLFNKNKTKKKTVLIVFVVKMQCTTSRLHLTLDKTGLKKNIYIWMLNAPDQTGDPATWRPPIKSALSSEATRESPCKYCAPCGVTDAGA